MDDGVSINTKDLEEALNNLKKAREAIISYNTELIRIQQDTDWNIRPNQNYYTNATIPVEDMNELVQDATDVVALVQDTISRITGNNVSSSVTLPILNLGFNGGNSDVNLTSDNGENVSPEQLIAGNDNNNPNTPQANNNTSTNSNANSDSNAFSNNSSIWAGADFPINSNSSGNTTSSNTNNAGKNYSKVSDEQLQEIIYHDYNAEIVELFYQIVVKQEMKEDYKTDLDFFRENGLLDGIMDINALLYYDSEIEELETLLYHHNLSTSAISQMQLNETNTEYYAEQFRAVFFQDGSYYDESASAVFSVNYSVENMIRLFLSEEDSSNLLADKERMTELNEQYGRINYDNFFDFLNEIDGTDGNWYEHISTNTNIQLGDTNNIRIQLAAMRQARYDILGEIECLKYYPVEQLVRSQGYTYNNSDILNSSHSSFLSFLDLFTREMQSYEDEGSTFNLEEYMNCEDEDLRVRRFMEMQGQYQRYCDNNNLIYCPLYIWEFVKPKGLTGYEAVQYSQLYLASNLAIPYSYMTDDQKNTYYYLLDHEGIESANNYIASLANHYYNEIYGQELGFHEASEWMQEGTFWAIVDSHFEGIENGLQGAVENWITLLSRDERKTVLNYEQEGIILFLASLAQFSSSEIEIDTSGDLTVAIRSGVGRVYQGILTDEQVSQLEDIYSKNGKITEIDVQYVTESITTEQYETIIEVINSEDFNALKPNLLKISYNVGSGIGGMAVTMALQTMASVIGGPVGVALSIAGSVFMGGSIGGSTFGELARSGIDKRTAWWTGVAVGAADSLSEYLFGRIPFMSHPGNPVSFVLGDRNFLSMISSLAINAAMEGVQEVGQAIITENIKNWAIQAPDVSIEQWQDQLWQEFIYGALVAGELGVAHFAITITVDGTRQEVVLSQDELARIQAADETNQLSVAQDILANKETVSDIVTNLNEVLSERGMSQIEIRDGKYYLEGRELQAWQIADMKTQLDLLTPTETSDTNLKLNEDVDTTNSKPNNISFWGDITSRLNQIREFFIQMSGNVKNYFAVNQGMIKINVGYQFNQANLDTDTWNEFLDYLRGLDYITEDDIDLINEMYGKNDAFGNTVENAFYDFIYNKCNGDIVLANQYMSNYVIRQESEYYHGLAQKLEDMGLSAQDARMVLDSIDTQVGACSYAAIATKIFSIFKNNPAAFKAAFGFDMTTVANGNTVLNGGELILDLFLYLHSHSKDSNLIVVDSNGNISLNRDAKIPGRLLEDAFVNGRLANIMTWSSNVGGFNTNLDILTAYFNERGIQLNLREESYYSSAAIEAERQMYRDSGFFTDEEVDTMVSSRQTVTDVDEFLNGLMENDSLMMLSTNGGLTYYAVTEEIGNKKGDASHVTPIVGIGEFNGMNGFFVASWGDLYFVNAQDLVGNQFVITEFDCEFSGIDISANENTEVSINETTPKVNNNFDAEFEPAESSVRDLVSGLFSRKRDNLDIDLDEFIHATREFYSVKFSVNTQMFSTNPQIYESVRQYILNSNLDLETATYDQLFQLFVNINKDLKPKFQSISIHDFFVVWNIEAKHNINGVSLKNEILSTISGLTNPIYIARKLYIELNRRIHYNDELSSYMDDNLALYRAILGTSSTTFDIMSSDYIVCKQWAELYREVLIAAGFSENNVTIKASQLKGTTGHFWVEIDLGDGNIIIADATDALDHGCDILFAKSGDQMSGMTILDSSYSGWRLYDLYNSDPSFKDYTKNLWRDCDYDLDYTTSDGLYYSQLVNTYDTSDSLALYERIFGQEGIMEDIENISIPAAMDIFEAKIYIRNTLHLMFGSNCHNLHNDEYAVRISLGDGEFDVYVDPNKNIIIRR